MKRLSNEHTFSEPHAGLDIITGLIEAQRPDLAMVLIEEERKLNIRWKGSDSVQLR